MQCNNEPIGFAIIFDIFVQTIKSKLHGMAIANIFKQHPNNNVIVPGFIFFHLFCFNSKSLADIAQWIVPETRLTKCMLNNAML